MSERRSRAARTTCSDYLVGCCVAASIEGVAIKAKKPPRKVSLSDLEWVG